MWHYCFLTLNFRFCELLERDLEGDQVAQQQLLRLLYPESCFGKNFSGTSKNVRNDLTVEKVRKFHERFYRPENACIVIAGKFLEEKLLHGLERIDKELSQNFPKRSPIVPTVEAFEQSLSNNISVPGPSVGNGLVGVGIRGPSARSDPELVVASELLLEYLVNEPLKEGFAER